MTTVVIVDDEKLIRKHLRILMGKLGPDVELIGEFSNGEEVISFVKKGNVPDIVITDIRMPVIDGIELIRQIRMTYPQVRSIIISGYADFEYARKAMHLGVTEYILKPIKREDLQKAVYNVCNEIETLRRSMFIQQNYEVMLREKGQLEISQLLGEIIYTKNIDITELSIMLQKLQIPEGAEYVVCLMLLNHDDRDCIRHVVTEKFCEIFKSQALITQSNTNSREFVALIYNTQGDTVLHEAERYGIECLSALNSNIIKSGTVGVSKVHYSINEVKTAYKEAYEAAGQRFIYGCGRVYKNKNINQCETTIFQTYLSKVRSLASYLEQNDKAKILDDFEKFIVDVFCPDTLKNIYFNQVKYLFVEIVHAISAFCNRVNLDVRNYFDINELSGDILHNWDECRQIVQFLITKTKSVIEDRLHCIHKQKKNLVSQIQTYIKSNFYNDMYLEEVAEKFNVSAKYLSRVFKDTVGMSYIGYLTELRIGFAKNLLESSHISVQEIAYQIGYSDHQYFHRVFKKKTGLTPNQYRIKTQMKKSNTLVE